MTMPTKNGWFRKLVALANRTTFNRVLIQREMGNFEFCSPEPRIVDALALIFKFAPRPNISLSH
jgi:hypothetical protein